MDPKYKGALSELRATAYLIEQGYIVCRNVSYYGMVDLIVYHEKSRKTILVDVKSGWVHPITKLVNAGELSSQQVKAGVKILLVLDDWVGFIDDCPYNIPKRLNKINEQAETQALEVPLNGSIDKVPSAVS